MKLFSPKKVFVEKAAEAFSRTQKILESLPGATVVPVDDYREVSFSELPTCERYPEAKRHLALAVKQGAMLKEFRRHASLKQDKEYYLLHAANCPFDCSYCYLQCYFESPIPTIFANSESLFEQADLLVRGNPDAELLFHAGETADALALEHLSGFAVDAVQRFASFSKATIELRTKSDLIEPLLPLEHRGRTVVSWTLTPEWICESHERGAASIHQRLKAAVECLRAGYRIGLRFDPVIHYPAWRKDYEGLIEAAFDALPAEQIDSIVMGTFRFPPRLLDIMRERFGRNELTLGEFVPGPDGKMRYFRRIRQEIYGELVEMMRRRCGAAILSKIELAMEPQYVWQAARLDLSHT